MRWMHVQLLSVFMICVTPIIMLAMLKQNIPGMLIEHVFSNSVRLHAVEKVQAIDDHRKEFLKETRKLTQIVKTIHIASSKCLLTMRSGIIRKKKSTGCKQ